MARKLLISAVLLLLAVCGISAKINGPTASFQIRWHVENRHDQFCELVLYDYEVKSEQADAANFNLAYTNEWQGLATLQYRSNIIKQNHTFTITATPLKNGNAKIGFTMEFLIGDSSSYDYDTDINGGTWIDGDGKVSEYFFDVSNSCEAASSGPKEYLVQHPRDIERKIVTVRIPIRIRINDLADVAEGISYVSQISFEVASP
jgi:hypothetical protein